MTRLYLIAGFLGAGKTTFLKNFLSLFAGQKIALLINEFGREGVDGKLLAGFDAELSEITGGSVFCTCRLGAFEEELEKLLQGKPEPSVEAEGRGSPPEPSVEAEGRGSPPDLIIVEASGLSDPTSIRRILGENPLYKSVEYAGCICIADSVRFPKVYATARTCRKQIAAADVLVLNKLDIASPEEKETTLGLIRGQRPDLPVIQTSFGRLPDDASLLLSPPTEGSLNTGMLSADISLHSLVLELDGGASSSEAEKILAMIAEDTYRMKGFLRLKDGQFLADCVAGSVKIVPYENAEANNHIAVLYGHGLSPRKAIAETSKWYPGKLRLAEESAIAPAP